MKLFLLKTLLQRRARDEGFTLPMVIALGLVMLLLGMTNIVQSGEENLNASIQNSSSDALAVAEVGITKYREFLNQNRILTIYNHNQWTSNNVGGVDVAGQICADMTKTPAGWFDGDNDSSTNTPANDTTQWWEVREDMNGNSLTTDDEDLIGKYRLVSYIYDNDGNTATNDNGNFSVVSDANVDDDDDTKPNYQSITDENDTDDNGESDAIGILTVQGQSPDGSEAQIQVEIPLRVNLEDMPNLAPVLWIGSRDNSYINNFASNVGTVNIPSDANIVRFEAGCGDPDDIIGSNSVISDARGIPPITSITDKINEAAPALPAFPGSINTAFPPSSDDLGNTNEEPYVTPPSGNRADFDKDIHCTIAKMSNCRYYYRFNDPTATTINFNDGNVAKVDGIAKVTVYVDDKDLNINADITGSSIASNYLEIYVAGDKTITIDSDTVSTVNAFIHAPDSELKITGGGTVNIIGSVWVDEFDNDATVNFGKDSSGTFVTETTKINSRNSAPTYTVYSTTNSRTPRPLTSSPTNWVKEEVE